MYTRNNGHLLAWKASFAGCDCDHRRGSSIGAGHGHLHIVENPGKRRALLPTYGRKPEFSTHDQHPPGKAALPTSHAGTRVVLSETVSGAPMPRLRFHKTRYCYDVIQISS